MSRILQSPGVMRVHQALADAGVAAEIVELPGAARTAKEAARFLGCEVAQIANSLVFRAETSGAPLLVMCSGARRVDLDRLARIAGEPVVKADARFVRERTGFAIGGVPPLGHATPLRTLVDDSLAACAVLWAAAGHPHTVFRLSYAQLLAVTRGMAVQAAAP
ncbi:MAG TPA: YbaK/EbsC family protein [Burkholderiales bacterium]|nr:YbaK/EbsC family protein [Burkholderiales bacterium]